MKKNKLIVLLMFIFLPCALLFTGCEFRLKQNVYITSVEKTGSSGLTDYYTFHRSDGSTFVIEVQNGKDGEDGDNAQALTLSAIKEYCEENGLDLDEYIKEIVLSNSVKSASYKAIQSAVTVVTTKSIGSGVIYKMDSTYSYIVTNYHVTYDSSTTSKASSSIYVVQYGESGNIVQVETDDTVNGKVSADYVGGSMTYDIAVLRVKTADLTKNNANARAVDLAESYSVADTCIAVGNPEGEGISVTSGIVSVESEILEMEGADGVTEEEFRVMRHTAPINSGNSGGGLFNQLGQLIGITNAKIVDDETDGWFYALPVDNVKIVADELIATHTANGTGTIVSLGSLSKLYLDVSYYPYHDNYTVYNEENVTEKIYSDFVIQTVTTGKLADNLGMKKGDIIKSIQITNSQGTSVYTIDTSYRLGDILLLINEGDKVIFNIKRDNETISTAEKTITSADLVVVQ